MISLDTQSVFFPFYKRHPHFMVTAFIRDALYEAIRIKDYTAHNLFQLMQIHFVDFVQPLLVKYAFIPKVI